MKCDSCHEDIGELIVLIPLKQGGRLESLVCLECARKSGYYCLKHEHPHQGYSDDTSACLLCVDEMVRANLHRVRILAAVVEESAPLDMMVLSEEKGLDFLSEYDRDVQILRVLCEASLGKKITLDDLVRKISADRSLKILRITPEPEEY
ncbi:hypothetical protein KW790_03030 [Candidatus Parcubacteria bacterium]|nr:hypothetical protein [Candidatus Parcubacteria bacterium]